MDSLAKLINDVRKNLCIKKKKKKEMKEKKANK